MIRFRATVLSHQFNLRSTPIVCAGYNVYTQDSIVALREAVHNLRTPKPASLSGRSGTGNLVTLFLPIWSPACFPSILVRLFQEISELRPVVDVQSSCAIQRSQNRNKSKYNKDALRGSSSNSNSGFLSSALAMRAASRLPIAQHDER